MSSVLHLYTNDSYPMSVVIVEEHDEKGDVLQYTMYRWNRFTDEIVKGDTIDELSLDHVGFITENSLFYAKGKSFIVCKISNNRTCVNGLEKNIVFKVK